MIRGPWPMSADKMKFVIPMEPPYLTPMYKWPFHGWVRVVLRVSAVDAAKAGTRGPGLYGTITDLDTGERYLLQGRPCDLPTCYCDAEIIEITTTG